MGGNKRTELLVVVKLIWGQKRGPIGGGCGAGQGSAKGKSHFWEGKDSVETVGMIGAVTWGTAGHE
jgi:hypothetical protein